MDRIIFQDEVKNFLIDTGRTQKWLAAKVNISQPLLSMWLRGKTSLNHDTIRNINDIVEKCNN